MLIAPEAGASGEHPIEVGPASQIDPHARSLECPRCGPRLKIAGETARVIAGRVRRIVELECVQCGERREAHFAIVEPLLQ